MSNTVSPLAPQSFPQLPPLAGVALGTLAAGLRYQGRDDLFVAELAEGTSVAGVFTRSLCPSAPVDWCKQLLDSGTRTARAVVCNAGNANAFTGSAGRPAFRSRSRPLPTNSRAAGRDLRRLHRRDRGADARRSSSFEPACPRRRRRRRLPGGMGGVGRCHPHHRHLRQGSARRSTAV